MVEGLRTGTEMPRVVPEDNSDFRLTTEVMTEKDSNSGVYLRGVYEVQILESYGREVDSHNMGAIYSRITPSVAAERPIGKWQTLDITLWKRHVTVKLNGKTIVMKNGEDVREHHLSYKRR